MKSLIPWTILALVLVGQTGTQTSTSTQTSGHASGSGQASGWASASGSASGGQSGFGSGGGNGFAGGGTLVTPNYAIVLSANRTNHDPQQVGKLISDEWQYWAEMAKTKQVVFAGPWREADGGLVTIRLTSDAEAKALAWNDPAVKAGLMTPYIRAWNVTISKPFAAMGTGNRNGQNGSQSSSERSSSSSSSSGGG